MTPDIDESLDDQSAKTGFWNAFKTLGPWWSGQPPLSLSRARAVALGALIAVLVVFGAGSVQPARAVPGRRDRLREPRRPARVRGRHLVGTSVGPGARVVRARSRRRLRARLGRFLLPRPRRARELAKLVSYILFGFWFLSLFEALWWLVLVALLGSVGRHVVRRSRADRVRDRAAPGVFDRISVALHVPGETSTANIGPPDIVFFALFLAAAQQFRLRVALTWISMTAFLSLTLLLVYFWDTDGLPALPAVCWGFLLPNLDLIWRDVRAAYAARGQEAK